MAPSRAGVAVALVALLLIAIVGSIVIYFGPSLCIGCPNSVGFNPSAAKHTEKIDTLTASLVTITTGPPAPGTSYGSVSWPIAVAASSFAIQGSTGSFGTWLLTLPGDASATCYNGGSASPACLSSSYQFTASLSSPALISQSNNAALYSAESSYLPTNPYTFNSTYTSNTSAAAGCSGSNVVLSTAQQCVVQWTIARYYFTVNMQTQGATLNLNCAPGASCQSVSCFFGTLCNTQAYMGAFQSGVTGALNSVINPAASLSSPSQLDFQVNLPPNLAGQSNLDSAGIIDAFTLPACQGAGQTGISVGDLCETNCGGVSGGFGTCSIVQSNQNTALSLFSDALQQTPYGVNIGAQVNVNSYTAAQLAALNLQQSVYTGFQISNFGAQFQMNSQCFISNYGACFQVSQPQATLTIGFDVLTTQHVIKTYPTPPPFTGTNAGGVDGQVVDGSLPWHPGVAGASVCFTDITGCAPVNAAGTFNLTNVAAGTHSVQITAPGFGPSSPFTVNVPTGGQFHLGQVALAELNPWYLAQFCIPNPLSFTPGGQTCIPYLVIGITAVVIVAVAVAYSKRFQLPKISR